MDPMPEGDAGMTPTARRRIASIARVAPAAVVLLVVLAVGVMSCQSWLPGLDAPERAAARRDSSPEVPTSEPELRVRIRAAVGECRIEGTSRFMVSTDLEAPLPLMGPLTATARDGSIVLLDGDGRRRTFTSWTPVTIAAEASGDQNPKVLVDGAAYPGRLRLHPRAGGAASSGAARGRGTPGVFDVVELVAIESYLPGVISEELLKNWPLEAFEAQSVAARTYALHQRHVATRRGRDFDLEATTQDQVYKGAVELPVAVQAVRDTRGVVVTSKGRLLRTYYNSTCGGRTGSAADVWPTNEGYEYNLEGPIQAHPRQHYCTGASLYRWEVVRDRDELVKRIREWGRQNGSDVAAMESVVAITVDRTNRDGRPASYRLRDAKGTAYELRAEDLRLACNQSVTGLTDVVLRKTRVASNDFEVELNGPAVTIRGRGFGHGVGLCQWCIKGMADRGMSWREMVPRFYPGAELQRAY